MKEVRKVVLILYPGTLHRERKVDNRHSRIQIYMNSLWNEMSPSESPLKVPSSLSWLHSCLICLLVPAKENKPMKRGALWEINWSSLKLRRIHVSGLVKWQVSSEEIRYLTPVHDFTQRIDLWSHSRWGGGRGARGFSSKDESGISKGHWIQFGLSDAKPVLYRSVLADVISVRYLLAISSLGSIQVIQYIIILVETCCAVFACVLFLVHYIQNPCTLFLINAQPGVSMKLLFSLEHNLTSHTPTVLQMSTWDFPQCTFNFCIWFCLRRRFVPRDACPSIRCCFG